MDMTRYTRNKNGTNKWNMSYNYYYYNYCTTITVTTTTIIQSNNTNRLLTVTFSMLSPAENLPTPDMWYGNRNLRCCSERAGVRLAVPPWNHTEREKLSPSGGPSRPDGSSRAKAPYGRTSNQYQQTTTSNNYDHYGNNNVMKRRRTNCEIQ